MEWKLKRCLEICFRTNAASDCSICPVFIQLHTLLMVEFYYQIYRNNIQITEYNG